MERVEIGGEESPADDPQVTETTAEETPQSEQQEESPQADRPGWLPEKFGSPEDLAKAYGSLEKKLSSQKNEEQGLLTQDDFEKYSEEYTEKGNLTDESYEALAKRGLSKELVDDYIRGRETVNKQQIDALYQVVGGEENYGAMIKWAEESLQQEDLDAFNDAVSSSNMGVAKLAIQGMAAQWQRAGGDSEVTASAPSLLQGSTKSQAVGGYGSNHEMMQDMKDPRYKNGDVNFHAHVEKRLARTNL
jgi:hypothetical protein